MKIECKPTFSYYFNSIESMSKKCIEGSNDNINWVELTSLNTTQSTFTPQDYYRYYRFRFDNNSYGNFEMRYCYISQVIYKETKEVPYDVVSNTINEVPCDTLLQPRTKYELIYNEDENKFELGGAGKIIFDTTLTSNVNSIDTNIQLIDNKLYKFQIRGSLSSAGSVVCTNENGNIIAECYVTTSTASPFCSEFTICGDTTNIIEKGSSSVSMHSAYFTGSSTIKTIKAYTTSTNITSGTRIIILEVA